MVKPETLEQSVSTKASLDFLSQMIRFKSYSGTTGESELARFMVDAMKGLGLDAFLQEVEARPVQRHRALARRGRRAEPLVQRPPRHESR